MYSTNRSDLSNQTYSIPPMTKAAVATGMAAGYCFSHSSEGTLHTQER